MEILRFEFGYQIRRPWPWLFFGILAVVSFLMTRDASLSEALYDDFLVNSPFNIAKTTVFGSVIWLLIAAVIAGEAGARDVGARMYPLLYTSPVSRAQYLGGRFLAAFTLNLLLLLGVQLGALAAVYALGVDPKLIGPFRPAAYLTAYLFLSVPTAFVATGLQFGFAVRSGRAMASYAGSMLLIFFGFFVASLLAYNLEIGKLLDPVGIRFVVEDMSRMWTPIEKNVRLLSLDGELLANRLVWSGVGIAALFITFVQFRFEHRAEGGLFTRLVSTVRRRNAVQDPQMNPSTIPAFIPRQTATRAPMQSRAVANNQFGTHVRQTRAIAWASFRHIATSWVGLFLLLLIPLLSVAIVIDQMQSDGGVLVPTTARVLRELTAPVSAELSRWVIVPLLIVFFAGELIWREREARVSDIVDAMPGSDWSTLIGKLLGLTMMLALFLAMQMFAGMLAQTIMGYGQYEIGLYLKILFGLQLPEYVLFAIPAIVVHTLVNQKYVAHLVGIMLFVFIAIPTLFGVEHNLLVYGAGPTWSYTNMRGFGPSLAPSLWFKLYWAAWALLLAVVARLFWPRGKETAFAFRAQQARLRWRGATLWTTAFAAALVASIGGYVFYNTNVLNEYFSANDVLARRAQYERLYGRYADVAQPTLVAATLRVDIFPENRSLDVQGTYRVVNESGAAIDTIHVAIARGVDTGDVTFSRAATRVLDDETLGHRMYALQTPLEPGDSLQVEFRMHRAPRGFTESGVDVSVVANGTSFLASWLPAIGYQDSREILLAADRRKYDLPPQRLIHSLYDTEARRQKRTGIALEAIVSTSADQIAVAPGALRREWTANGRRYFQYVTDGAIGSEWAFFSARYDVHAETWQPVDSSGKSVAIRIYHRPGETAQLDRMIRATRSALTYYSQQFGPYRYNHLTVVEGPGEGTGLHAEATMITHSEGFNQWQAQPDSGSLDFPSAVIAHEMAHQWTVPYAFAEGAPVMSESIAWYYAMRLFQHERGEQQLARLLNRMRQPSPYPPIKRGEPLLRGLDPYMSYRRGPFALYGLGEYIGEARVNAALRTLLATHRGEGAPLATTLDLYRELAVVTPDSLRYLLHDLFEANTFWNLSTRSVTVGDSVAGGFPVTLQVSAKKTVIDTAGRETEVPMNDWMEIGVYAADSTGAGAGPVYLRTHRVRSGVQSIAVLVPRRPGRAGIDPRFLFLTDLDRDDNVKAPTQARK